MIFYICLIFWQVFLHVSSFTSGRYLLVQLADNEYTPNKGSRYQDRSEFDIGHEFGDNELADSEQGSDEEMKGRILPLIAGAVIGGLGSAILPKILGMGDQAQQAPAMPNNQPPAITDVQNTDNGGMGCFHGSGLLTLENGMRRKISDVVVGDSVLAMNESGGLMFSPIILQLHSSPEETAKFSIIQTESGRSIALTPQHLIYRKQKADNMVSSNLTTSFHIIPAEQLKIGDFVLVRDGYSGVDEEKVLSTRTSKRIGVFSPLTLLGNIVVDNIVASCYSHFDSHQLQHLSFAPFRWIHMTKEWATTCKKNEMNNISRETNERTNVHWYAKAITSFAENICPSKLM